MNKLEDFTEGSEWITKRGVYLKFHSFDPLDGLPLFTTSMGHMYTEFDSNDSQRSGTIGFVSSWKAFKKI